MKPFIRLSVVLALLLAPASLAEITFFESDGADEQFVFVVEDLDPNVPDRALQAEFLEISPPAYSTLILNTQSFFRKFINTLAGWIQLLFGNV